jgi:EAL domain-containing protein (putative c-di-GMP-specific phosphodiesterase class I)
VYQPIVSLENGEVLGAEALMRWRRAGADGRSELVPPDEFIPVAEDIGVIRELGAWALHTACAAAVEWQALRPDRRPLGVAVNVSGRQLAAGDLELVVRDALAASGLASELLTLELTESALMERRDDVMRSVQALKALGVRLSVDDFGTGYSSLARLQRLPVDEVKIDRAFVASLALPGGATPIVEAVLALAAGLGHDAEAEGIERADQLDALRRRGCLVGQGYAFARPVPGDEIVGLAAAPQLANGALNFSV